MNSCVVSLRHKDDCDFHLPVCVLELNTGGETCHLYICLLPERNCFAAWHHESYLVVTPQNFAMLKSSCVVSN